MSFAEFIAMGGYGQFVWPAYAVTLIVLIGNVFLARASHRRATVQSSSTVRVETLRTCATSRVVMPPNTRASTT